MNGNKRRMAEAIIQEWIVKGHLAVAFHENRAGKLLVYPSEEAQGGTHFGVAGLLTSDGKEKAINAIQRSIADGYLY